jgi:hypothetical protein
MSSFGRLYARIARTLAHQADEPASIADWLEAVKGVCARTRIPYSTAAIWLAIEPIVTERLASRRPKRRSSEPAVAPTRELTRAEAANIWPRLLKLRMRLKGIEAPVFDAIAPAPALTEDTLNAFKQEHVWHR